MALDRKDIRAKLDPDMHKAISRLAEAEGLEIGEFIERELLVVIQREVRKAMFISEGLPSWGKNGSGRE